MVVTLFTFVSACVLRECSNCIVGAVLDGGNTRLEILPSGGGGFSRAHQLLATVVAAQFLQNESSSCQNFSNKEMLYVSLYRQLRKSLIQATNKSLAHFSKFPIRILYVCYMGNHLYMRF